MTEELFIEIGTEEIPARFLDTAQAALGEGVVKLLGNIAHGAVRSFSTPRRLAVSVQNVSATRPSAEKLITGPAAAVAFKDGQLTPAGEAFARKNGVPSGSVFAQPGPKGEVAAIRKVEGGEATLDLLAAGLEGLVMGLPFKKTMRWRSGNYKFARPIHYVCARLGGRLIEAHVAGVYTTLQSRGHGLHAPASFAFKDSLDWLTSLRQHFVLADPGERRGELLLQLRRAAEDLGAEPQFDAELLDEVVNLVEWPKVIVGAFPAELLELPSRLLVESMKKHQRYFPIYRDGVLSNQFLVVTNAPFGEAALIAEGNARVLAARFHDAKFFYAADRRLRLEQHGERLDGMTWIRGLGTMADRQRKLAIAAAEIAADVGADASEAAAAAGICKADLATQMVGEFPELQGHVGRLLALHQGASVSVAMAIEEHYLPRFAGDFLPQTPAGRALALTERLTLLSACWSIGLRPSASSDPQGLRRAAQGILQILLELGFRGDVRSLLDRVCPENKSFHAEVADFIQGRLKALLVAEGHPTDLVEAVLATSGMDLVHDAERVRALGELVQNGSFGPIKLSFRRAAGLVKDFGSADYNPDLFEHEAEKLLHGALLGLPTSEEVAGTLVALARFQPLLAGLFEGVLVMCPDERIRDNRLGLLKAVTLRFGRLADFTRLSVD